MTRREFQLADEYKYDQTSAWRWIVAHASRYKGYLTGITLGVTLANLAGTLIPILVGRAFNIVLEERQLAPLVTIVWLMLGIVVVRAVADVLGQYSMEVVAKRLERDARDEFYLNLLGKSQTFHNRQRVGDIMARATSDMTQLSGMMMPGIALIMDSMAGLLLPILFMGLLNWQLLLAPGLFTIAFYFALRRYMDALGPVSDAQREQFGVMNAGLNEAINGIEVIKTAAQEPAEQQRFSDHAALFRDHFIDQGRIQARYTPPLWLGFARALAFLHGLWLLSRGIISVGDLVAYIGLMDRLRFPAFISIFTFSLVQLGLAGAERILSIMQQETEIDVNADGYAAPMTGEIVFENVSFGYGDRPVLKNVSFTAQPGETIAIVGQTGSGKSTLTGLVNRTYDVDSGRILIDGRDVREWNLAELRSQISTIEQDVFLFSRSIADNIAFGLGPATTTASIRTAAMEAQADSFIESFAEGYNTVIGERGVTLSGGQRQRLAIARALLTDPRILIIDDATSAIDSATEDRIQKAISRVLKGRTTLLITHRLAQIRRADRILVLRGGEIIDQGQHTELLQRCDLYQRIFQQRVRGTTPTVAQPNGAATADSSTAKGN